MRTDAAGRGRGAALSERDGYRPSGRDRAKLVLPLLGGERSATRRLERGARRGLARRLLRLLIRRRAHGRQAQLPEDVDSRHDLKGSAAGTPGLTALDEEREASLADEGGASGAHVESQDEDRLRRDRGRTRPSAGAASLALLAGAAAAGVLVALAFRRR